MDEFKKFVIEVRAKLADLPRGNKQWWKLVRMLSNKSMKKKCIPPLRDETGAWVAEPRAKADLLTSTFKSKSKLPHPGNFACSN